MAITPRDFVKGIIKAAYRRLTDLLLERMQEAKTPQHIKRAVAQRLAEKLLRRWFVGDEQKLE